MISVSVLGKVNSRLGDVTHDFTAGELKKRVQYENFSLKTLLKIMRLGNSTPEEKKAPLKEAIHHYRMTGETPSKERGWSAFSLLVEGWYIFTIFLSLVTDLSTILEFVYDDCMQYVHTEDVKLLAESLTSIAGICKEDLGKRTHETIAANNPEQGLAQCLASK